MSTEGTQELIYKLQDSTLISSNKRQYLIWKLHKKF